MKERKKLLLRQELSIQRRKLVEKRSLHGVLRNEKVKFQPSKTTTTTKKTKIKTIGYFVSHGTLFTDC